VLGENRATVSFVIYLRRRQHRPAMHGLQWNNPMKPSTDRCFCGRLLEQCDEWVCIIESRSRAALSAGERADLPEVRGEPAMPVDGPTLAPHGERTQGKPQSIGGTPEMSARPGYRVPALERRYPPGCPDPDWCAGNNVCYWECIRSYEGE